MGFSLSTCGSLGLFRALCGAIVPAMAILKIARMGHPVLATPAKPVADPPDPEIRRLVNDMVETMIDANGAGLAAPQVHVPLRVVVFQAPRRAIRPRPVGGGAFRPHRPPDRVDKPAKSRCWTPNRGRLGRLPVGSGPARLGRAARPYPLSRPGPGRRKDRAGGTRLSRPGGTA